MTVFQARVQREDGWWVAVVAMPGYTQFAETAATQARTLAALERDLDDLVKTVTGESGHSVATTVVLPVEVRQHLNEAVTAQAREAQARQEAVEARRSAARLLAAEGLSVRDIGAALGISFQRAHQLLGRPAGGGPGNRGRKGATSRVPATG